MQLNSAGRLVALACAAIVAGCGDGGGGGNESATVAGNVFKGPLNGASVCVYPVDNAAATRKGARLAAQSGSAPTVADGCVVTGSDGAFRFVLPGTTGGALLVESTGGTYCSDESLYNGTSCSGGGTPIAMGTASLHTVVAAPASGVVNAPLTLLTTAAALAPANLSVESFNAAYGTVASAFGVSTDASTSPTSGSLSTALVNLSAYVGSGTGDLADIVAGIAAGTLVPANTTFPRGIEFAVGTDQKSMRVFTVTSAAATLVSTATLPGIPGAYARSGSTVTVTMQDHNIPDGLQVTLNFDAGTGGTATSGTYKASVVDTHTFTVTDSASGAITAGKLHRDPVTRLTGSYSQAASSDLVTITIPGHGLQDWYGVDLHFTTGGAADFESAVETVLDADTLQVRRAAAATASATGTVEVSVGTNYSAFDTVMHPSGKWLYVSSGYECSNNSPFCWGGDVITTYRIDWQRGKLTPVSTTRTMVSASRAVPVKMAINAAGTRMVHQDDDLDGLVLWSIDPATGALVWLSEASGTRNHGVAFSADGQYVYNGTTLFTISGNTIARTMRGTNGNAGQIFGDTLFFIVPNNGLYAASLAAPASPTLITNLASPADRDLFTRNGSLLLASGFGGIKSYTFGTGVFAAAAGAAELQRDGSANLGDTGVMYRSVHLNQTGNIAVASYFKTPQSSIPRGGKPSGYLFATVAADGQLARITDSATAQYARSAKFIKQP